MYFSLLPCIPSVAKYFTRVAKARDGEQGKAELQHGFHKSSSKTIPVLFF